MGGRGSKNCHFCGDVLFERPHKAILENSGTLKPVPDCYKNQTMCNKAVDNYAHALESVPDCYNTQEVCGKAVNTSLCNTICF